MLLFWSQPHAEMVQIAEKRCCDTDNVVVSYGRTARHSMTRPRSCTGWIRPKPRPPSQRVGNWWWTYVSKLNNWPKISRRWPYNPQARTEVLNVSLTWKTTISWCSGNCATQLGSAGCPRTPTTTVKGSDTTALSRRVVLVKIEW